MKIDFRLLTIVACAFVVAGAAIVMTRQATNSAVVMEIIPPKGVAMTDRVPDGMQLEVTAKGLTLTLPECNLDKYKDKFFLHLYTRSGLEKNPPAFINLDFFLAQETGLAQQIHGEKSCVYLKPLSDFSPQQVNIGQFTVPNGNCCEITWSRTYIFDRNLLGK